VCDVVTGSVVVAGGVDVGKFDDVAIAVVVGRLIVVVGFNVVVFIVVVFPVGGIDVFV